MKNQSSLTDNSQRKKIWDWLPLAAILLLATFLYFYQLNSESLWIDELNSLRDADRVVSARVTRPLYFLLLRAWMQFGTSEIWLKSLSILFALLSVVLTYVLGRQTDSKETGWVAALLLTLSPLFINHSQEIRMYCLGTCLGIAGTLALFRSLQNFKAVPLVFWAIFRWLMFLAAPLNIALIFADIPLAGLRFRRHRRLLFTFGLCLLGLSAACLPNFLLTAGNSGDVLQDSALYLPLPSIVSFSGTLTRFTIWSVKPPFDIPALKGLVSLYGLLATGAVGFVCLTKFKSAPMRWCIAWWFIPQLAVFVASHLTGSLWVERYLLFTAPYAIILISAGLVYIWKWKWQVALCWVLVYAIVVSGGLTRYYTVKHRDDWRGVVQAIENSETAGDDIAIHSKPNVFNYYYEGSSSPYIIERAPRNGTEQEIRQVLKDIPAIESRLWLAYAHDNFASDEVRNRFESTVDKTFAVEKKQSFQGVTLFLTTPK